MKSRKKHLEELSELKAVSDQIEKADSDHCEILEGEIPFKIPRRQELQDKLQELERMSGHLRLEKLSDRKEFSSEYLDALFVELMDSWIGNKMKFPKTHDSMKTEFQRRSLETLEVSL